MDLHSPPDVPSIEELKELIKQAEDTISQTVAHAGYRIRLCANVGKGLRLHKKQLDHRQWLPWLEEHFSDEEDNALTPRTAQRWMKLSEAVDSGRLDLDKARSVRHAYQLAGILPDPDEAQGGSKGSDTPNYLVHLDRLEAALRTIELNKLSEEERRQLAARLDSILRKYGQNLLIQN